MPGKSRKSWATSEQSDFLQEFWPEYLRIHDSGQAKYDGFWARLFEDWFSRFPEVQAAFPGINDENSLTEEQCANLSSAITARKEVSFIQVNSLSI